MKNWQKYRKELVDISGIEPSEKKIDKWLELVSGYIGLISGVPVPCISTECSDCEFADAGCEPDCGAKEWLLAEYDDKPRLNVNELDIAEQLRNHCLSVYCTDCKLHDNKLRCKLSGATPCEWDFLNEGSK